MADCGSRIALGASLGAPAAALAQTTVPGPSVLPTIVALVFVVALIPAAMWLLKRFGAAPGAAAQAAGLKVVAQLPLGARERLVVLEAGDRWLLLGVTAGAVNRVGTLPKPAADSTGDAIASPTAFRQLLQQIRAGR
jgi:flagellar protein FliO/FliZ